jgi:predicted DNA-binding protein (UPF0251 family)
MAMLKQPRAKSPLSFKPLDRPRGIGLSPPRRLPNDFINERREDPLPVEFEGEELRAIRLLVEAELYKLQTGHQIYDLGTHEFRKALNDVRDRIESMTVEGE